MAGPVTVCAVQWLDSVSPDKILNGIRDSKKLSPKKRGVWLTCAKNLRGTQLQYAVHSVAADDIDQNGIVAALSTATAEVLHRLNTSITVQHVYADHGLPIPKQLLHTHIVKGDEKNPLIALASIIAKETRDTAMRELDEQFPLYGLAQHKGYGTKYHFEMLRKHGPSPIHRKTFLRNILPK